MLGQIRLQWWRDSITQIDLGQPPHHAVVQPLADAIIRHGLQRKHFDRLIDAREADLDDDPPADMAALEEYAEATSAPLVWLALDVLGAADDSACRAGREVGIVWRSEEHTSELQSLMRISYAVFGLKKKNSKKAKEPVQ